MMPLSYFESIPTETRDLFVIHLLDVFDDSRSSGEVKEKVEELILEVGVPKSRFSFWSLNLEMECIYCWTGEVKEKVEELILEVGVPKSRFSFWSLNLEMECIYCWIQWTFDEGQVDGNKGVGSMIFA
ncbi:uncharacterized protein LOC117932347 [Vitis riparia]|uniref:uncharacterized protein LOC117932347 n=1 Tax=Vitis riparia TaxID=96939 RepID=UPI00155A966F|nr:uncharacterized protein LOC117932347 [Vitis riparia]